MEKSEHLSPVVWLLSGAVTMEDSTEVSQKIKSRISCDPAISFLGICPKQLKTRSQRDILHNHVQCSITIVKLWKQVKCPPADKWIKKRWYIYTGLCYLAFKKKVILSYATIGMNLEDITRRETSHSQDDKYCRVPLIRGI